MDFLTLGLGLLIGYVVGSRLTWLIEVRPLLKQIIAMKKLGFNEYRLPEKTSNPDYTYFVRED